MTKTDRGGGELVLFIFIYFFLCVLHSRYNFKDKNAVRSYAKEKAFKLLKYYINGDFLPVLV